MAIELANKLNTAPISADYPFGDILDRDGSNPGTEVNRRNHADFHQFFSKLMDYAGIAYNGEPDSAAIGAGFQLFEAFLKSSRQDLPTLSTNVWAANDVFDASVFVSGASEGPTPQVGINAFRSGGLTTISGVVRIYCDTATSAITTPNTMTVDLALVDDLKPNIDNVLVTIRGVATGSKNASIIPIPAIVLYDDTDDVIRIISNYDGGNPTIVANDFHDVIFSISYKSVFPS